jgi:RNA polymerase sigma-70 factor (ECF subfamily)
LIGGGVIGDPSSPATNSDQTGTIAKDARHPRFQRTKMKILAAGNSHRQRILGMYQVALSGPGFRAVMTDNADDESLIRLSQAGDKAAIRTLVERHAQVVFRIAYRMVGRRDQAEDIAQDVLTSMLSYSGGWFSKASFLVWLRRAVLNRTIDTYRRRRSWMYTTLEDAGEVAGSQPQPDAVLNLNRRKKAVAEAVLALPERQRMAVILCFYEWMSLADAAEVLGTSASAVESLLQRAKTVLKVDLRGLREGA